MRLDRKGGRPMKKGCILLLLMSVISLPLIAQNIIYSNLKELLAQDGDTVAVLRVERRSKNQIVLLTDNEIGTSESIRHSRHKKGSTKDQFLVHCCYIT